MPLVQQSHDREKSSAVLALKVSVTWYRRRSDCCQRNEHRACLALNFRLLAFVPVVVNAKKRNCYVRCPQHKSPRRLSAPAHCCSHLTLCHHVCRGRIRSFPKYCPIVPEVFSSIMSYSIKAVLPCARVVKHKQLLYRLQLFNRRVLFDFRWWSARASRVMTLSCVYSRRNGALCRKRPMRCSSGTVLCVLLCAVNLFYRPQPFTLTIEVKRRLQPYLFPLKRSGVVCVRWNATRKRFTSKRFSNPS